MGIAAASPFSQSHSSLEDLVAKGSGLPEIEGDRHITSLLAMTPFAPGPPSPGDPVGPANA